MHCLTMKLERHLTNFQELLAEDFNVHHDRWFSVPGPRNIPGLYAEVVAIMNGLTQLSDDLLKT